MKITWLGHASFRIAIEDAVLLVDPWLTGNPAFPDARRAEALQGATHILVTHGHGDHASEVAEIAGELAVPVFCGHELSEIWGAQGGFDCTGMGKGGTVRLGRVAVTMVNASHSASVDFGGGVACAGSEAGYMIAGEGHTIYLTGDTDIMADMEWMGDLHKPDIGIMCAGGHYTMDMARVAYVAKRYFSFSTLIPSHYRTFPVLAQSAEELVAALPDVDVRTPEVMETVEI